MAGFEDLIRSTLQKQGDQTPERRAAIYQSSRSALERMIAQNDRLDHAAAEVQRKRLESAILTIEEDYLSKGGETVSVAPPDQKSAPEPEQETEPGKEAQPDPQRAAMMQPEPASAAPPAPETLEPDEAPKQEAVATTPQEEMSPVEPIPDVASTVPVPEPQPAPPEPAAPEPALNGPPQPRMKPLPVETPEPETEGISGTSFGGLSATRSHAPSPAASESKVDEPAKHEPTADPVRSEELSARREPVFSDSVSAEEAQEAVILKDYDGPALRERRPYAKLLLWAIILAGIGVAIWWAINFGPALLKAQFDGAVDNPRPTIEDGSFVPEGEDGWVSIFSPESNPDAIDTGNRGKAEILRQDGRSIARLASNAGAAGNNIRIRIPRGVMNSLRGKAATFEITVAGRSDSEQQFAVFCQFAAMGECGRKRFDVRDRVEPQIFDVLINDTELSGDTDAYLAINTDIGLTGRPIDLYSVRVRTGS